MLYLCLLYCYTAPLSKVVWNVLRRPQGETGYNLFCFISYWLILTHVKCFFLIGRGAGPKGEERKFERGESGLKECDWRFWGIFIVDQSIFYFFFRHQQWRKENQKEIRVWLARVAISYFSSTLENKLSPSVGRDWRHFFSVIGTSRLTTRRSCSLVPS